MGTESRRIKAGQLISTLLRATLVGIAPAAGALAGQTQQAVASGSIIYVDAESTGANDGTSWADAFTDLQDALDAATAGDEIWVPQAPTCPRSCMAALASTTSRSRWQTASPSMADSIRRLATSLGKIATG